MKKVSGIFRISEAITKYSIYLLVFLLPVLYIPWVSRDFDFLKQATLILFSFVAGLFWVLKILSSGKASISQGKVHFAVLFSVFAYFLSNIFSLDKYGSFWGSPGTSSDSLLSMVGLAIVYFIVSNEFSKKEIIKTFYIFLVSAFFSQVIAIPNFFSFNTIGSPINAGFFSASIIPLLIILIIKSEKRAQILLSCQLAASTAILFLANYFLVWWLVAFGALLVILLGVFKKDFFDTRWLALPAMFLLVSLGVLALNPYFSVLPHKTSELTLAQKPGFEISLKTLQKNPVLGSGPGTFSFDFLKYRALDANTNLNGISFNRAGSKFLTDLAELGILGIIVFFILLDLVIFFGAKFFYKKDSKQKSAELDLALILGLFLFFLAQSLAIFLYSWSLTLNFVYFLTIACLLGIGVRRREEYEFNFRFKKIIFSILFLMAIVLFSGVLFMEGQRVLAETNYYSAITFLNEGKVDEALLKLQSAASLNPSSGEYFRILAEANILKLKQDLSGIKDPNSLSEEQKNNLQQLVSDSINAAKRATDINQDNAGSWLARGYVYQNLIGLMDSAQDWAITSYNRALELDPQNSDIQKVIDKIKSGK